MKYLLLSLSLLIPSISYADSVTSGSVGLLKPTVGVAGTRNWGDINNSNMDVIAATFNTVIAQLNDINVDTVSLKSDITKLQATDSTTSVRIDQNQTALSTTSQRIDGLQTTVSTISGRIDNLQTWLSTQNTQVNNYININATNTNRLSSTATWTASQTFGSSTTFSSGTLSIGGNQYYWQSSAPPSGDSLLHYNSDAGRLYFGGDGGSGGGGGGVSTSAISYGLVLSSNGTNTNVIIATAQAIDIMGCYYTNLSTQVGLNLTGPGGNAIGDTANTWYKIFLISDNACTTYGIFVDSGNVNLSTSLPSGFTKQRAVGWVYNDASANIVPFYKRGNYVAFWQQTRLMNAVDPGTTPSFLDLVNVVSPGAINLDFMSRFIGGASFTWMEIGPADQASATSTSFGQNDVETFGYDVASRTWHVRLTRPLMGKRSLRYVDPNSACTALSVQTVGYNEDN